MKRILLAFLLLSSTASAQTLSGASGSGVSVGASSGGVGGSTVYSPGSCTDGVNCYCDAVLGNGALGTGDSLYDSSVLLCEDVESLDYYENTANDWAAQPYASYRGGSSRFTLNYGAGAYHTLWHDGQPVSPKVGDTCDAGGADCAVKEWCSPGQSLVVLGSAGTDCWDGNDGAAVDIQRNGDVEAEIGTNTLTGGNSGGGDIFDGNQHFAYRVQAATLNDILGTATWSAATELGVTMAVAYPPNLASTGVAAYPWKHEEFGHYPFSENFHMGNTGVNEGLASTFPFNPIMFGDFNDGPNECNECDYTEAACDAEVAAHPPSIGVADCDSISLNYGATFGTGAGQYSQSADWPFGTWGCVRAYITGMGTTSQQVRVWFNEEEIINLSNFDALAANLRNLNYGAMKINAYANANQGTGETPTSITAYRYFDNMHIRNGVPVSCNQIGFTGL